MEATAILYPGAAMFFLTFAVIVNLGIHRFRAVGRRKVRVGYYRPGSISRRGVPIRISTWGQTTWRTDSAHTQQGGWSSGPSG